MNFMMIHGAISWFQKAMLAYHGTNYNRFVGYKLSVGYKLCVAYKLCENCTILLSLGLLPFCSIVFVAR